MSQMVAALFVATGGAYYGLEDVEPWDVTRDARLYAGPWPVVAHPPCERWGRFWFGGPQWLKDGKPRKVLGDDDGCFASALEAVRRWGGVIEHPADSRAWRAHGLKVPPRSGGWVSADGRGWTCCVYQGHYGHAGQKATWLYARWTELPSLIWGKAERRIELPAGETATQRRRRIRTGTVQALSKRQRAATPIEFRDGAAWHGPQRSATESHRMTTPLHAETLKKEAAAIQEEFDYPHGLVVKCMRDGAYPSIAKRQAAKLPALARRHAACLAGAAALEPWQEIETLPEGRIGLLFAVTHIKDDGSVGNWKMATGSWHQPVNPERDAKEGRTKWTWDGHDLKVYDHQPTHWKPLPAPPAGWQAREERKTT